MSETDEVERPGSEAWNAKTWRGCRRPLASCRPVGREDGWGGA